MPKLSPRDIKRKIGGIKNTARITNAMKVVSAAKMRKAQEYIYRARPYSEKLYEIMRHICSFTDTLAFPVFKKRDIKTVDIIVITADRGLAGAFNTNVIKAVEKKMRSLQDKKINLHLIGKKAVQYFSKRKYNILSSYEDVFKKEINFNVAKELASKLRDRFETQQVDEILLFNNEMITRATYQVVERVFLPLEEPTYENSYQNNVYNLEGDPHELLDQIIDIYINYQIYRAMLESNAAEHFARMVAMDNATRNANELIKKWTLIFNKARQEAITAELIDIVTAAEAMNN